MDKPPEFLDLIEQVKTSCNAALEHQADAHTRRLLQEQLLNLQQVERDYQKALEETKKVAGDSEFLLKRALESVEKSYRIRIDGIKTLTADAIRNIQGFKRIV